MRIIIAHRTIVDHDAIGTDILHMRRILSQRYPCFLHAEHLLVQGCERIDGAALQDLLADPDSLLIYHHSLHWEAGEALLRRARGRVVIKYHNITPESFYRDYSFEYHRMCRLGRRQTERLSEAGRELLWMADSSFNLEDAGVAGRGNAVVVPPFNHIDRWRQIKPDAAILRRLIEDSQTHLLFVGRIAPNKGLRFLLDVVHDVLAHHGDGVRLHVIGKRDPLLVRLDEELKQSASSLGVADRVSWVGEVPETVLLAYYLGCDFYVNASEHEGFCLPLVEAQSMRLPVISRRAGGVSETLGPDQLILEEDVAEYSAAIRVLSRNDSYTDFLQERGLANYRDRFQNRVIEALFRRTLSDYIGAPL